MYCQLPDVNHIPRVGVRSPSNGSHLPQSECFIIQIERIAFVDRSVSVVRISFRLRFRVSLPQKNYFIGAEGIVTALIAFVMGSVK